MRKIKGETQILIDSQSQPPSCQIFSYESDGSVYFDTVGFDSHPDCHYAKLEPWSAGNVKLIQEGEGT